MICEKVDGRERREGEGFLGGTVKEQSSTFSWCIYIQVTAWMIDCARVQGEAGSF